MPGLVPARRSYSAEEDEDTGIYNSPTPSEGVTPRALPPNKRPRLEGINGNSSGLQSNDDLSIVTPGTSNSDQLEDQPGLSANEGDTVDTRDSWHLVSPTTVRAARTNNSATSRQSDIALARQARGAKLEHKAGSIVRVTLKNFVTYTSAEFLPGPALNMVIGPNGTGKSTLVCAICLGLGWGPKHLGRAKEPGEFVKHGSSEAEIEIELKGSAGKRNTVIKRVIRREGNKSSYFINGESSSGSNVLATARSFGTQVDNLCHFLPQDRVVEFAGLTPVDRLTETLRAAAPAHMVESHTQLKTLRVEQRTAERSQASVKQNLANLEGRQNAQRADVERIREREEVVDKVSSLEKLRPISLCNSLKAKYQLVIEQKKNAATELKKLKHEVTPGLQAVNAKQQYKKSVDKAVERREKLFTETKKKLVDYPQKKTDLQRKIKDCVAQREAFDKGELDRKKKLALVQSKIKELEVRLREPPIEFDAPEYNERSRDKERQYRALEERIVEIRSTINERQTSINTKNSRIAEAETQIKEMTTQEGQQMEKLRHMSPDTYKAWVWVKNNLNRFSGPIYGPPLVTCTIKDKHFAASVEGCLQQNQLLAITATNKEDFKLMQAVFQEDLGLSTIYPRNVGNSSLKDFTRPVSDEEMQRLGVDAWAIDYLEGPEPVLAMLCGEARLHATAIIRQTSQEVFERLQQSPITNWVDREYTYSIRRRREYAGHSSTMTKALSAARYWTDQAVDNRPQNDLRENIEGWKSEVAEFLTESNRDKQRMRELKAEVEELKDQQKAIDKEKADRQKAVNEQKGLPTKLEKEKAQLEELLAQEASLQKDIGKLCEKEDKIHLEKAQLAIDHSRLIESVRNLHVQFVVGCIAQIEATSDLEQLEARNVAVRTQLETMESEYAKISREAAALKTEHQRATLKLNEAMSRDEGLAEYYNNLSEADQSRLPEELEQEIESQKARLELLHAGDPRTVREYEQRAKDIERLQGEAQDNEDTLTALEQSIAEIRARWEPELLALVEQISSAFGASFEKINCAGGVEVHKGGSDERDFENWAININVKFRQEEELQKLDSHRQSGGERAVSTIFYLMALQSLSRAPFRVVDEINQGMDPRNERMVHEMMVDVACGNAPQAGTARADTQGSQYFLITPKLLTDLKYSPGIKVHCIASGEYMPQDYKELDFGMILKKAKSLMRRANGLVDGVGA